ncbi:tetratricopeptide repeat protein [Streptomyces monticola]|uniref:Tetratricopeptide repeat protein n=1 Tax=Streptomyces monticola TaxID=2666263 RepID=A0ABW2JIH6_9ACTN
MAEYLASGPQVLSLWKRASRVRGNPRGAALVAAAVDLARTGLASAVPAESLERLHEYYLEEAGGLALRPEPLDEAWHWASEVVLGVTSPLIPARKGHWKPFDYLVSDTARRAEAMTLPEPVWGEALSVVENSRRISVSTMARAAGRPDIAISVVEPLAEVDDLDGLITLGALLFGEGDHQQAIANFWRAAELGDATGAHNLGAIEMDSGNLEDAIPWLELAIERGEIQSIGTLGMVYEKLGDGPRAVKLWKSGTAAGDAGSALHYSDWLRSQWKSDEALEALRVAAEGEIPFATLSYAGALLQRGETDDANAYISKAYEVASRQAYLGEAAGALMAGVTAYSTGNTEMGDIWWARAIEKGVEPDWFILDSPGGLPGLAHMAISRKTLDLLGEDEARTLMQGLWAKDCLECGHPLGSGVPALCIDDHHSWADARLFHFGICRYPVWNDSALVIVAKGSASSWISVTGPIPVKGTEGIVPALFVNPSLETSQLMADSAGRWSVTGAYGPRSRLAEMLKLRPLWKGLADAPSDNLAKGYVEAGEVAVATAHHVWSAPAAPEFINAVKHCGGLLLVLTSALGPGEATMETILELVQSWDAMTRWVELSETS